MMSTTNTAGHSSSARPMQKTRGRRGTLFHYTLVYMTIASAILSVAGVILHSVLKADASDRRESLFLSSLSRAEQQLRKDSQTNGFRYQSETLITTAGVDDSTIDWVIDLGILNRKVSRGDAVIATDRFIFPAGSQLRFQQASSDAVVVAELTREKQMAAPVRERLAEPNQRALRGRHRDRAALLLRRAPRVGADA